MVHILPILDLVFNMNFNFSGTFFSLFGFLISAPWYERNSFLGLAFFYVIKLLIKPNESSDWEKIIRIREFWFACLICFENCSVSCGPEKLRTWHRIQNETIKVTACLLSIFFRTRRKLTLILAPSSSFSSFLMTSSLLAVRARGGWWLSGIFDNASSTFSQAWWWEDLSNKATIWHDVNSKQNPEYSFNRVQSIQ